MHWWPPRHGMWQHNFAIVSNLQLNFSQSIKWLSLADIGISVVILASFNLLHTTEKITLSHVDFVDYYLIYFKDLISNMDMSRYYASSPHVWVSVASLVEREVDLISQHDHDLLVWFFYLFCGKTCAKWLMFEGMVCMTIHQTSNGRFYGTYSIVHKKLWETNTWQDKLIWTFMSAIVNISR